MMRSVFVLLLAIGLFGCAGTQKQYGRYYQPVGKMVTSVPKQYRVSSFHVTLQQKVVRPDFPDQKQFEQIVRERFVSALVAKNLLAKDGVAADVFDLNMDVTYQRVFFGEDFGGSKTIGRPFISISSQIKQGPDVVATYNLTRSVTNHGMIGNLISMGKHVAQTAGLEEEDKDINALVAHLLTTLPGYQLN